MVSEPRRGYGRACLAALAVLPAEIEIVVFLDADASDDPSEATRLVEPILRGEADLVVGSRARGHAQPGSLFRTQRAGNRLAVGLIRLLYLRAASVDILGRDLVARSCKGRRHVRVLTQAPFFLGRWPRLR